MSGVWNTLVKFKVKDGLRWKFCFFTGLIYMGFLLNSLAKEGVVNFRGLMILGQDGIDVEVFDSVKDNVRGLSFYGWVISGLLVGIGTKAGNGCTSGHGVCGLPRFSLRSLIAVITFMGT
mmetsp:Transcript_1228/g.1357  ORF Transcript_1228/g.1357 Transcript_1228/m.1357 type:complete len:120 (+) Transcript_1228:104-463(+)